jgi:hypothetical protein
MKPKPWARRLRSNNNDNSWGDDDQIHMQTLHIEPNLTRTSSTYEVATV